MFTATASSPHAVTSALPPGSVRLRGDGPLARLRRDALGATIPSMGEILFSDRAHAYRNFLVAAGEAEGDFVGPPFTDGDFYKWLEAAVVVDAEDGADELGEQIERAIVAIAAAQEPDGYLQTKTRIRRRSDAGYERFHRARDFETYNHGHLMTLAALRHRLTGDRRLLDVAIRAADFLIETAADSPESLARCNICPSHYMGAVELHRETGDARYLALAERLLDLHGGKGADGTDDNQDVVPVAEQRAAVGHAVRANYLYAGMADVALETGDARLGEALEAIWSDLVGSKIAITGGCGALYDGASPDAGLNYDRITRTHQAYGRPYQQPQVTAYHESCASLGLMFWAWRMLSLTGRGEFADEIERVLFNALPAMIGADATTYFYTNPLRQVRDLPFPMRRPGDVPDTVPPPSHERSRQAFMKGSFCCPPNLARVLAELPYYLASTDRDGLSIHQFVEGDISAVVDGVAVDLAIESTYPAGSRVSIRVRAEAPVTASIRVRVPGWAPHARVGVAGVEHTERDRGYAVIRREWHDDEIVLDLSADIAPRLMTSHPLVEETTAQVAVMRGPVVYCVESADLPAGIGIDRLALPDDVAWEETEGDAVGIDGHVVLRTVGYAMPDGRADAALYRPLATEQPEAVPVTFVPYARWANRGPGEMTVWMPLLRRIPLDTPRSAVDPERIAP